MLRFLLAISLLTALSAIAGPYDQPYAIVETGAAAEARNEGRVTIARSTEEVRATRAARTLLSRVSERFL